MCRYLKFHFLLYEITGSFVWSPLPSTHCSLPLLSAPDSFNFPVFLLWPLQIKLSELESELLEIGANSDKLLKSRNELAELQLVLEKVLKCVRMSLLGWRRGCHLFCGCLAGTNIHSVAPDDEE